jgi:hypothetical protein
VVIEYTSQYVAFDVLLVITNVGSLDDKFGNSGISALQTSKIAKTKTLSMYIW